ncbi:ABC transporter ATP-binding protein [Lachnospiraceae bacterium OttesenSCG-928-D06]|nr:ABC transporter ATP-binding protein [Lachnospiraceae bacterium OttesenSCG-928-D06]
MAIIEIQNLKKYYGKHMGTEDVSFSVDKGEFFGFVGPNGAGKSTTIKFLLGFIFADAGSATICGRDVVTDTKAIKNFTAYVPSDVRFYENMKVAELLKRNGRFYQCASHDDEAKRLCTLFDLDVSKQFRELSTGNKKKVSLVCAMASKPDVLILDEPTNGLDPIMQKKLFIELQRQTQKGATVLLSSHNLTEVQEYCSKVAFIKNGKILTVKDLKKIQLQKIITVYGGDHNTIHNADIIQQGNNKCVFRHNNDSASMITLLKKIKPLDFVVENESMEDYFMTMYGEETIK